MRVLLAAGLVLVMAEVKAGVAGAETAVLMMGVAVGTGWLTLESLFNNPQADNKKAIPNVMMSSLIFMP